MRIWSFEETFLPAGPQQFCPEHFLPVPITLKYGMKEDGSGSIAGFLFGFRLKSRWKFYIYFVCILSKSIEIIVNFVIILMEIF